MILSKQSERAAHRANHTENHRKQIVNNSVLRLDKSGMFKKILKKSLVSQSLVNPEIRPSSRSGMLNVNAYAGALTSQWIRNHPRQPNLQSGFSM